MWQFARARGAAIMATTMLLVHCVVAPALAQDDRDDGWDDEDENAVEIHGFVEGAGSARVGNDPTTDDDFLLGETRFRLELSHFSDRAQLSFKGDFISDAILQETRVDIRQAWLSTVAGSWLDLRVGRQILTWGTGDLLFLNDLFAKDFVSFFIGRDDEFLKAPSNTLKFSAFWRVLNIDLAWTPVFTPDRFITGERLSFYDRIANAIVSGDSTGEPIEPVFPARTVENSETALRVYRTLGGYELAAYGYRGFFKRPLTWDPVAMAPTFSRLAVAGASARGNAAGGIFNVEGSYYASRDDRDGTNPLVPNSEVRALVGYDRELVARVNLGLQYYVEWLQDYDALVANSPAPANLPRETRQLITTRLTWRLMQETLTLSLFGYIALGDNDTYWRPVASRQWTDNVSVALGANVMTGDDHTFFGQLEHNSNVYLRFRYSF